MAKTPNYTEEQTAEMIAAYMLAPNRATIESLATKLGKTTRSIIAKLSREKIYKAAEYVGKNGAKPETKEQIVSEIAAALNVAPETLNGLDAATKVALTLIRKHLQKM